MKKYWSVLHEPPLVIIRWAAIGLSAAIVSFAGFLLTQYLLPTSVTLSYAQITSCAPRLVAFSGSLKHIESNPAYRVSYEGGVRFGSVSMLSTRVCVTPTRDAEKARQTVRMAPFGLGILSSRIVVEPGADPTIESVLASKIPITKPLIVSLSSPDVLHTYNLHIADQMTTCENGQSISCQLDSLEIDQGKSYDYKIERSFIESDASVVAEGTIDIEDAVTVKSISVKNNQTVYDKIKSITIKTNKAIAGIDASLTYDEAGKLSSIPLSAAIDGGKIVLSGAKYFPREKDFSLTLENIKATDGSTLLEPKVTKFSTSGGPRVTSSSVASTVTSGSTISIYLDQPVAPYSLSGRVTVNGAAVTASAHDKTISLTLPSLAQCSSVNIKVDKGLVGTKNDLKSTSAWSATSRVACGSSKVIGYSVHGRPMLAYYFGTNGGATMLFTGGIHGSEPSSTDTMNAWVDYLRANAYRIPAGKQIVIIPNMNPDGIAAGDRLNANAVNLDRNYPTDDWQKNIDTVGGYLAGGGGSSPGSEPETKAAMAAISGLSIKLSISYHAQGSLVGSNNYSSADNYAHRYASAVGYGNMSHNAEETMGYAITGEFETWLAERGVPAILIELPTPYGNYLSSHRDVMWAISTE